MADLKYCFDFARKAYQNGDMRIKDSYEGLMDLIDRLSEREDRQSANPQAKPSQTTIYHQIAAEKVKTEVQLRESREGSNL